MVIDFYDTSALLSYENPENLFSNGLNYVSHFVLSELEDIKNNSSKDENIKARARKVSRFFLSNPEGFMCGNFKIQDIEKIRKKYSYLPNNMDGLILAEAKLLKEKKKECNICFHTADVNMYLFANKLFKYVTIVRENELSVETWSGFGKYYPTEEQLNALYSNPQVNILGAKINEYCEIFEGQKLKDILRWDGKEYCKLKYKEITSALGQKWHPLNIEQKMLFDLLQNDDIPVKLTLGNFGSGKTALMLAHALKFIQNGQYDGLVFVRNNIEVKDTVPLGALPNDEVAKLMPFLMPIVDHVGLFTFEDMLSTNVIEPIHLGFLRGRDVKSKILFCDECENLTAHQVQLLIGRIGKGSALWMAGDLRQTDKITFEKNNGIRKMIDRLQNDKLFGMVKLQQSVRSDVCRLADKMD